MLNQNDFRIMQSLRKIGNLTKFPSEAALEIYCEKLAKFDFNQIAQAVEKIIETWDKVSFPPVAIFLQTIKEISGKSSDTASLTSFSNNRIEEARRLQKDFYKSNLYKIFEQKHYVASYLQELAWLQAQHLAGVTNVGYCGSKLQKVDYDLIAKQKTTAENLREIYINQDDIPDFVFELQTLYDNSINYHTGNLNNHLQRYI